MGCAGELNNLEEEALKVLKDRPRDIEKEPWFLSPEEVIKRGLALGDKVEEFFEYAELWPKVMEELCGDEEVKKGLEGMYWGGG